MNVIAELESELSDNVEMVELADAEGMNPQRSNLIFMLLMATVIAISMKKSGLSTIAMLFLFMLL